MIRNNTPLMRFMFGKNIVKQEKQAKNKIIMKKIFYIVALCCTFAACDKTENEEMLQEVFVGGDSGTPKKYENMQPTTTIYHQEFDSEAGASGWTFGNNQYAQYAIENGQYSILAKQGFSLWRDFAIDATRDFQMEVYMSCIGNCGIIFDRETQDKFGIMYFNDKGFTAGRFNGSAGFEVWIQKNTVPYTETAFRNSVLLYTIRKVGSKVYVFLEKKYLYSTDYTFSKENIGFYLSKKNDAILADYIHIDYIEKVSE
ncbi:hypothetical protein FACS189434_01690 [Bacteroidia bacterium]|nr:hypothetical protein FACS189434_01690 [Bacteroidia bacterium]